MPAAMHMPMARCFLSSITAGGGKEAKHTKCLGCHWGIVDPVRVRQGSGYLKKSQAVSLRQGNRLRKLNCSTDNGMVPPLAKRPSIHKSKELATDEVELNEDTKDGAEQIHIGNRTFYEPADLFHFFGSILTRTQEGNRVPTEEAQLLLNLLIKGHAIADDKIGCGVKFIFADRHPDYGQKCFMLMRKDGSTVDFSYRKCINNIAQARNKRSNLQHPRGSQSVDVFVPKTPKDSLKTLITLCKQILLHTPVGDRVSEDQTLLFFSLISKGHPNADEKLGNGVEFVFVGLHPEYKNKCFMLKRMDGSSEDFSYRKCINNITAEDVNALAKKIDDTPRIMKLPNTGDASNAWNELSESFKATLEHTPIGHQIETKDQEILLDLLIRGHPEADEKVGCGVSYIFVDRHPRCNHKAFMVMRKDGTTDDFSFMKCIRRIMKEEINKAKNEPKESVMQIGSRKFKSGAQIYQYFASTLGSYSIGERVSEEHNKMLLEVIVQGHPNADEKLGNGVEYVYVGEDTVYKQKCFLVMRKDGSSVDFSYRKCVSRISKKNWGKDPARIVQLRDTAKDLLDEKLATRVEGKDVGFSMISRVEETAKALLDQLSSPKDISPFIAFVTLGGLAFCLQIDKITVLPLIEEHESFLFLLQTLDRSRDAEPPDVIVKRISFLSHFSTANKTVGEVYAGDVVAAIESADELHISILILLLRALPRHELPKNANVGYAVSVLQRKLAEDRSPMSCKHLNHLVEVLFSLNLKPGRFISEANITPILSPECTEYTAIAILRRFGQQQIYPGPKLVNQITQLVIDCSDVGFHGLTELWVALVHIRHKLPFDLLGTVLQLAEKQHDTMSAPLLASWIWGFGRQVLQPPLYDTWIKKIALWAQDDSQKLTPRQIVSCLWSMAVLRKYEVPEFKLLWSLVNQTPVENLGSTALSTIYQVSVAVELECPNLHLRLSNTMYIAAAASWTSLVKKVTVSPVHLDVFHRMTSMGFKAVREYVTSRHLFSIDIVLLPPGYPVIDGMESGVYEDAEQFSTFSTTGKGFSSDQMVPSSANFDETSLTDVSNTTEPKPAKKLVNHFDSDTAPELSGPPIQHPGSKIKVPIDAQAREFNEKGQSFAKYQGGGDQLPCDSLDSTSVNNEVEWLLDVDEMPVPLEQEPDDSACVEDIDVVGGDYDVDDDMGDVDGPTRSQLDASINVEADAELRVQRSTFVSPPQDQLNLEAALECDMLPLVAIEVDGKSHYFRNRRHPLGRSILRERLMKKLGWRIVHISSFKWSRLTSSDRERYFRSAMQVAGIDIDSFLE